MKTINNALIAAFALCMFLSVPAQAEDAAIEKIKQALKIQLPTLKIESVTASPISGLYEVMIGPRLFYMSADGRYLLAGEMTDLQTGENLTDKKMAVVNKKAIDQLPENEMIIFGSDKAKDTVTVFTDIDCGYCRKLHTDMQGYNDEGIRIRYLFYPRAGVGSGAYDKAVSVWCADDNKQAMTDAKNGKPLAKGDCKNPVASQYELGQLLGISGTPALVLEDGTLLPGYLPPKKLKAYLDEHSNN